MRVAYLFMHSSYRKEQLSERVYFPHVSQKPYRLDY